MNGTIYTTTVKIGTVSVTGMKVLMVTSFKDSSITNSLQVTAYDGLCGLTPKSSGNADLLVDKLF